MADAMVDSLEVDKLDDDKLNNLDEAERKQEAVKLFLGFNIAFRNSQIVNEAILKRFWIKTDENFFWDDKLRFVIGAYRYAVDFKLKGIEKGSIDIFRRSILGIVPEDEAGTPNEDENDELGRPYWQERLTVVAGIYEGGNGSSIVYRNFDHSSDSSRNNSDTVKKGNVILSELIKAVEEGDKKP